MQTRVETRIVCPAELDQTRPTKPVPGAGAQVSVNTAGGDYIKALGEAFDGVARLFDGAKAGCPASGGAAP